MRKLAALGCILGVLLLPLAALADSISPTTFSATIGVGGTAGISKHATITAGPSTTGSGDIFFLADSTGSMSGAIGGVKTGASSIMTATSAFGSMTYGAGEYRDNGDAFVYRQNQALTASTAAAQAGINVWAAGGGGDYQEADLYALAQTASSASGWRAGTEKFVVWFGDASGHDPSGPTGITEAQATAALTAAGIQVLAINVGTMDDMGQASRIAAATGGQYFSGINSTTIAATITAALAIGFTEYSTVALDLRDLPAGLLASYGGAFTGDYDRSTEREFDFGNLIFTGVTPGTYDFNVYLTLDGGDVAIEREHIVVTGTTVPEPATMLLLGLGLLGLAGAKRRKL